MFDWLKRLLSRKPKKSFLLYKPETTYANRPSGVMRNLKVVRPAPTPEAAYLGHSPRPGYPMPPPPPAPPPAPYRRSTQIRKSFEQHCGSPSQRIAPIAPPPQADDSLDLSLVALALLATHHHEPAPTAPDVFRSGGGGEYGGGGATGSWDAPAPAPSPSDDSSTDSSSSSSSSD